MSSIMTRTSISSSTTRTLRPESNLSIASTAWQGNVHRADKTLRPVVEMCGAFQLMGQTTFDHTRPKAFLRR
jgi:hypothetical protein